MMGLTTSLYTGLSGLTAHSRRLDVVGNNISNVNTTAFKGSSMFFQAYRPQELRPGTAPNDDLGGTNPYQVGFGVRAAATLRDWQPGSIQITGDPRDMAIDGQGLFVVERNGNQFYTRDGAFRPNANDELVNINGDVLLGYGVDAQYNVVEGALQPITIPLGQLAIADATTAVEISGNLDAGGDVAQTAGIERLLGTSNGGFSMISTSVTPTLNASSLLVDIEDPDQPGTDSPLFAAGQTLTFSGVQRGGVTVPDFAVSIDATTTVQSVLDAINTALGIDTTATNPDGTTPGAQVNPTIGSIDIVSGSGTISDIDIEAANIRLTDSSGSLVRLPFVTNEVQAASGESGRTTIVAFDSLGTAVEVELAFTMVAKNSSGTTWRYDLYSNDNLVGGPRIGSGTVTFDTQGELVGGSPITASLNRGPAGADSPLTFTIDLASNSGRMTALSDSPSEFNVTARDGFPPGVLREFGIAADGTVQGAFSNGAVRTLGQVVVATFTNYQGLVDIGNSLFQPGANSGAAVITTPGEIGSGQILSGSLEQSNVDLGEEFIELILTSTGYTASSRVISTADDLMQQLLVLAR